MQPLPDPSIGLLVLAARHAMRQAIAGQAARFRLTNPQFWALVAVGQIPGISPGELGHWMQLDAPAASRLVADLARKKLLVIEPDRQDRRRTRLLLTEKGQGLSAKLRPIADAYHAATVRGMAPPEIEALRKTLRRMAENLAGFDGGEPAAPAPEPARRARGT